MFPYFVKDDVLGETAGQCLFNLLNVVKNCLFSKIFPGKKGNVDKWTCYAFVGPVKRAIAEFS